MREEEASVQTTQFALVDDITYGVGDQGLHAEIHERIASSVDAMWISGHAPP